MLKIDYAKVRPNAIYEKIQIYRVILVHQYDTWTQDRRSKNVVDRKEKESEQTDYIDHSHKKNIKHTLQTPIFI